MVMIMSKNSNISDEQILSALVTCKTQEQAAEQLGFSTRQLYDRIRNNEFKALYNAYKTEILRRTVNNITILQNRAISVYNEILSDPNADINVKLKAADSVMKHYNPMKLALEEMERKTEQYESAAERDFLLSQMSRF